ncbi:MAG: deoxyuridine 5'-triphosphate nucleotidohydrolase [Candidatus Lloydbacteria bacterium RIFCSPHIGHO2_01_FULL_41_20]|uniref:dUTP diphosphatase n=1 Tax=Candidatus Lloydbacteria bacterium RIFCSPHIGHO2_01_FULL_41_20 TaxID=1798657 RepID=A0A1G2CTA4_9BACT|nr:MAG: deoxyuridine 5'-triphosphate nucleotidohydrolase [Candidatus Lloydbacteria bacterium RIFCSPHIGHO2_01_FULL_41_20]
MILKLKKLKSDAKLPSYAHPGDAGMDIYSCEERTLLPQEQALISTGIAMEIPDGYVGLVWDKSGLSTKHGLKTLAGVIDAGYRGEISIAMANVGNDSYTFKKGEKIAQMLIQKVEHAEFWEVDKLSETSRGTGGFGSTGKH